MVVCAVVLQYHWNKMSVSLSGKRMKSRRIIDTIRAGLRPCSEKRAFATRITCYIAPVVDKYARSTEKATAPLALP